MLKEEVTLKEIGGGEELGLMNAEEVAKYLNIKTSKVRQMVFRDELPVIRIGRLVRFERRAIKTWIDGLRAPVSRQAFSSRAKTKPSIFEIDTHFNKGNSKGISHD